MAISTRTLKNKYFFEKKLRDINLKKQPDVLARSKEEVKLLRLLFVNTLVKDGKKLRAEYWLHSLLRALKRHMEVKWAKMNHFEVLTYALLRLRPLMGLRRFKLGRTLLYLPLNMSERKKSGLGVRYLIRAARVTNSGPRRISMEKVLELVLLNAHDSKNTAFQARAELHKAVREGMAFSRFLRWL